MRKAIVVLTAAVLVGWAAMSMWSNMVYRFMFPRHLVVHRPDPTKTVTDLDKWTHQTDQGPVDAWFMPAPSASPQTPAPAVVFAHGNGELIGDWPPTLQRYRTLGLSVLIPEYRGYGGSAGSPTPERLQRDFAAFYDRLAARPDVDASRIVFHGRSIGGGVVCALAKERKPAAMILMSTFADLPTLMKDFQLPAIFAPEVFDNRAVLRELSVPTLIIHGTTDTLIPHRHAQLLKDAASGPVGFIEYPTGHNDTPPDWSDYFSRARGFLTDAKVLD